MQRAADGVPGFDLAPPSYANVFNSIPGPVGWDVCVCFVLKPTDWSIVIAHAFYSLGRCCSNPFWDSPLGRIPLLFMKCFTFLSDVFWERFFFIAIRERLSIVFLPQIFTRRERDDHLSANIMCRKRKRSNHCWKRESSVDSFGRMADKGFWRPSALSRQEMYSAYTLLLFFIHIKMDIQFDWRHWNPYKAEHFSHSSDLFHSSVDIKWVLSGGRETWFGVPTKVVLGTAAQAARCCLF